MQWAARGCGVFAAIVAFVGCACGGRARSSGAADGSPSVANGVTDSSPSSLSAVRLVGRFDPPPRERGVNEGAGGPRFAWSGSSFEARFQGTSMAMRLRAAPPRPHKVMKEGRVVEIDERATPYSVTIDGLAPVTIQVSADRERYELAAGLDPSAPHDVRVVREAEAFAGVHELLGVEVSPGGKLLAPRPRSRRIEVIGDSISCGYGILGDSASCHFTFATERASAAYPGLLGGALDADVTNVCWSGKGVLRNYDGSTHDTMRELFETALPPIPLDDSGSNKTAPKSWEFSRAPAPEAVIMNLGTNDFLGGRGRPLDVPAFEDAYVAFARRIRSVYPAAWIFVTTSAMMTEVPPAFARVVSRRSAEGDARIELITLPSDAPHWGCDTHPDTELNVRIAARIAAVVKIRLGLPAAR